MQLTSRKFLRALTVMFVVGSITGLGVLPDALPVNSVLAAEHNNDARKYGRLPVMKLTDEQLRALPGGQQKLDRELHRQGQYSKRWHEIHELVGSQHISRRASQSLRERGLGPALLEKADTALRTAIRGNGIDTLEVLIIRIGFETNRDPHLTTIDPSGDFNLGTIDIPDTLLVDPPPHNKAFYEAHLSGLSEYYGYQSGGRLHIKGMVLPLGENDSYRLTDVADYGPGADGFWSMDGLESLVRDCMTLADAETQVDGSGINLADYDDSDPFKYIIFVHAGSDYQSDILQDSPNDIPTFFITLGEPQALSSINTETGLPGSLSECSIIPETTNQDGYPGSIAAAFYHEFGHALGLVDVYNTGTALPQVGIWDLMDSGTNLPVTMYRVNDEGENIIVSATGVLPPSLGAWNKWYLGWLKMDEIDGRTVDYRLPAVSVPRSQYTMYTNAGIGHFDLDLPQALKGGLSTREWFLIENRWVPPVEMGDYDIPYQGLSFETDEATGVVLYLAGYYRGSWVNSGLYDYFMPAGGVLVWQVNMDRIESELATNTINYYGDGLRLVEADGIQDIGVLDAYVLGWYGGWRDPFGEGNGFRNLFAEGAPATRCSDRSWSGLSVSDIRADSGRNDTIMRFSANLDPIRPGFPFEVAAVDSATAVNFGASTTGPRALDVSTATAFSLNSEPVLVFSDSQPENWDGQQFPASLFAIDGSGQERWTSAENDPVGLFHHLDAPLAGPPSILAGPFPPIQLVAGTVDGRVDLLDFSAAPDPVLVFSKAACDSLVNGPLPLVWAHNDSRLLCCAYPDSLVVLDLSGNHVGTGLQLVSPDYVDSGVFTFKGEGSVLPMATSDLAAIPMSDGWFLVQQAETTIYAEWQSYPRELEGDVTFSAVVPDPASNSVQYHLYDAHGALGSWLISDDNSVVAIDQLPVVNEALISDPAVADVDGDGRHDIILATSEQIMAFHPDGISVRGFPVKLYDLFPLADSTSITGPLVVADATGDGVNELFFNTSGGHLVGLDAVGQLLPYTPFRWGDRRESSLTVGPGSAGLSGRTLWLMSAGGYTGPPLDRQFTNGRISAYQWADASTSLGTSEWLGKGGGPFRRGPAGDATSLGSVAPIVAELDQILLYPNPLHDDILTVRFAPQGGQPAKFGVFNLQGELVIQQEFSVTGGVINEHSLDLTGISSGLYVCRLMFEGANGNETKVMTLAVER